MADKRFFDNLGPFSVKDLATACGGEIIGCDSSMMINDVAPLARAGVGDISFMYSTKYKEQLKNSKASVCVIPPDGVDVAPENMGLIVAKDTKRASAIIIEKFFPPHAFTPEISPNAIIDETAKVGDGCRVDAGAIVMSGASIGSGTWVKSGAVIGKNVEIGSGCVIGTNSSLSHCVLGNKVITYGGVRIGEDGFGFALGPMGHKKVPQIGIVEIGDDVEIGANTCIDRGAFDNTIIGSGSRVDNLVQIGHNVNIGRGCYLVSQVGLAGSTKLEDFVILGGQVGVADNLVIGMGTQVAAQSGITGSLPAGSKVMGTPAVPVKDFFRQAVILQKMVKDSKEKVKDNKND